uniref:EGF-like domain-containing protein n=1 Tax=Timema genevievae TaxID=629358 RepID=A0A7R9JZ56_TIMGE|nr:unnamed protein product [Timema genevievae]
MGATVKSDSAGEARSCGVVASTPLCVLVLLVVQLVASSSSHTARLTFGTTFGTNVQNVQLNRTQTPPPPQVLGEPNGPRSARLTTFGVTNPKPQNNSNSRPAELLAEQPRPVTQERYTSKLSTVGRKPPAIPHNNTHTPPAPAVSGRTCKSDDNCAGIANTTCMNDPRDNKMRCLCPDKAGPINGHCPPKKKGRWDCLFNRSPLYDPDLATYVLNIHKFMTVLAYGASLRAAAVFESIAA